MPTVNDNDHLAIPLSRRCRGRSLVRLALSLTVGLGGLLSMVFVLSAVTGGAHFGPEPAFADGVAGQESQSRRWLTETVGDGDAGAYLSLALEPTAPYTPHISYYKSLGSSQGALKHAWRTPTGWLSETVDASGAAGWFTSLALEPSSPYTPHISYYDDGKGNLKHAWWTPTGWLSETVDNVGSHTSLALAPTWPYTPHISYYDGAKRDLKHTWWTPSGWLSETVDSAGMVGQYTSLALEPTPPYTPHIGYQGETEPKHAWWTPSGWLSETIEIEGNADRYTSLALESASPYTPHVSFVGSVGEDEILLKHAQRTPTGWLSETVDSYGNVGQYTSLALEPTAPYTAHITYVDNTHYGLKHAWWTPSGWLSETVEATSGASGDGVLFTSLALEPTWPHAPHVSYYNDADDVLMYAWLAHDYRIYLPLVLRNF
jgi:hypothetical protein